MYIYINVVIVGMYKCICVNIVCYILWRLRHSVGYFIETDGYESKQVGTRINGRAG